MSPALAGGFLTTAPPGKPPHSVLMVAPHSLVWMRHNWSTQASADGQLGGFWQHCSEYPCVPIILSLPPRMGSALIQIPRGGIAGLKDPCMLNFGRCFCCVRLRLPSCRLWERGLFIHTQASSVYNQTLLFAGVTMANLMMGEKDLGISCGFF